jgi:site-specific DNA recombinase
VRRDTDVPHLAGEVIDVDPDPGLVPIRLSRMEDNSNNPAMQRAAAQEYADEHPGTVLIFTEVEDLDVSGAKPMRERPGIGPYLTPEKINTWDGILGNEMDRLSRDMLDYLLTVRDLVARGKVVIDFSDGTIQPRYAASRS